MARDGNPGTPVDQGTLEYMRSQHIERLYDLPVERNQIDAFKERLNKLRAEYYDRSVLPGKLREGIFGYYEKVIVQAELADVFFNELKMNGYNGDLAEAKTRAFYKRIWPALKLGYSVEDVRKGVDNGSRDVNGPEGHTFDATLPNAGEAQDEANRGKIDLKTPRSRKVDYDRNPTRTIGEPRLDTMSDPDKQTDRRGNLAPIEPGGVNPFSLKKPQLKQQAEMLERNPVMARRMILAEGRGPKLFGLV